jgi:hypothetical protein
VQTTRLTGGYDLTAVFHFVAKQRKKAIQKLIFFNCFFKEVDKNFH